MATVADDAKRLNDPAIQGMPRTKRVVAFADLETPHADSLVISSHLEKRLNDTVFAVAPTATSAGEIYKSHQNPAMLTANRSRNMEFSPHSSVLLHIKVSHGWCRISPEFEPFHTNFLETFLLNCTNLLSTKLCLL